MRLIVWQQIVKGEQAAVGLLFDRNDASWARGWLDGYCVRFTHPSS